MNLNERITRNSGTSAFSTARFAAYFKSYISVNSGYMRRAFFVTSATVILIYVLMFATYGFDVPGNNSNGDDSAWDPITFVYVLGLFLMATFMGNAIFRSMNGKNARTDTLLLPVSLGEKFLTWFIIYAIGGMLMYMITFYVVDVFRVIVSHILYPTDGNGARILPVSTMLCWPSNEDLPKSIIMLITAWSSIFSVQALFACGSIFWYKTQYILSYALIIFMGFVSVITAASVLYLLYESNITQRFDFQLHHTAYIILELCFAALYIGFMYWLAFKRLKQTEIVSKW